MNYWDNLMGSDEGAATYMESYGEGPGCETRFIIGEFINEGESVLDVGCGPGWNMDHFMKYGPKVGAYRGEDYSERFVRVANERANKLGLVGMPFYLGDCRNLKHPDDSFDVVILQDVLEHTNGYVRPVLEALRVAKRRVIVTFWRMNDKSVTKTNNDGDDGYGSDYNKGEWEDYLNTLPYVWFDAETSPQANRQHLFYIIDKEKA